MSKFNIGKLLPNLNISVDPNRNDTTDTYVVNGESATEAVLNTRPKIQPVASNSRFNVIKNGGFVTGIDLLSEENIENLTKRAERFGLNVEPSKETMKSLYESLGITEERRKAGKLKHVRLDTIHFRGVNKLDSDKVTAYFQKYGPLDIEWVNDVSCNVVFSDEGSCARALLGLSRTFSASFLAKIQSSTSKEQPENSVKDEEQMEVDSSPPNLADIVDIPVPPGNWRLGVPYDKHTKILLLRFATTADKKIQGAESKSKYYQEHGNPNFGGLTGIISKSRKLKELALANKRAYSETNSQNKHRSVLCVAENRREMKSAVIEKPRKTEPFKIRSMYADEEELKAKKFRSNNYNSERKSESVHSRLGKKYTSEQLRSVGKLSAHVSSRSSIERSRSRNVVQRSSSSVVERSTSDLRDKLRRLRRNRSPPRDDYRSSNYRNNYHEGYYEGHRSRKYSPVQEIKNKTKPSYYKRKHRSVMHDRDDDDDDSDDGDSDSS